jgi:hypothetical protein
MPGPPIPFFPITILIRPRSEVDPLCRCDAVVHPQRAQTYAVKGVEQALFRDPRTMADSILVAIDGFLG